jgi:PAS domain S-box-containing protein
MAQASERPSQIPAGGRTLRAAIVGGSKGCESVLRMVEGDTLGRFRMNILGVADLKPEAAGMRYAREIGVPLVTTDYRALYDIPHLDLLIELTGSDEVRDEIERTRPRNLKFIDHFGARLFWGLHQAEEAVLAQRNEMRARVEAERERITQIFNCIPDEIVVVDTDMKIQDANEAYLTNNGYSLGEIRGHRCYDVDQKVRGECQVALGNCPFFNVLEKKEPISLVRKHFAGDGKARYAAIVAAPLFDRDKSLVGMIEMTRDITHRLLLEEELKATEVLLQQFIENAPMATYVKNRHGQYVEVNPSACRLLGREKHEIMGKTDLELLHRQAAESLRQGDREVLQNGTQQSIENDISINGKDVFLSTVKYPILDAQGKVTGVCGVSADVTLQKEAQAELGRTKEYLQNILDNSPAIIITTDLESRVVSFNRGAEQCLGYEHDEIIGRRATIFYRDAEERHRLLRKVTQSEPVRDYETKLLTKTGDAVPVSITLSQLLNSSGEMIGTVGISKDISQRKAWMDQIIQSERMAAVGRLAAGVAHEINNPLAVIAEIAGYLFDLSTGGPGSDSADLMDELREGLPKIEHNVTRCRNITFRLLSLARKTEARVTLTDVDRALDDILPFLEKEARLNKIKVHRECRGTVSPVLIEEIQLQEIFINLIQNAIQALIPAKQGNVWVTCEEVNRKVVVTVRDDGPGIAEEIRDRLFDPFVTTKPIGQGTGLGLSICYGIVKRYDGEIRVYSEPETGATFEVILPAAKPSEMTVDQS